MFRSVIAFSILAAAPASALPQPDSSSRWGLAGFPGGCMVHAASQQGTVLSIWGFAGQDNLGFLVQNRRWHSLREGERHRLKVAFDRTGAWPVEATARRDIDADGPGLFFTVKPGRHSDKAGFVEAFAAAEAMDISRNGRHVDRLSLAGSHDAMAALAACLGSLWNAMDKPGADETQGPAAKSTTV